MTDDAVDYKIGDTHEEEVRTLVRQFIFCKNSGECGEKNFSTQNSTQFLQKFTAFSAFNAKRCGRFAVKKIFFHRYSPLILHYFLSKIAPVRFVPPNYPITELVSLHSKSLCRILHVPRGVANNMDPLGWGGAQTENVQKIKIHNCGFCLRDSEQH